MPASAEAVFDAGEKQIDTARRVASRGRAGPPSGSGTSPKIASSSSAGNLASSEIMPRG